MLALTILILPTWHIDVRIFNFKRKPVFKIQILEEAHFSSLLIAFCGLATPLWTIGVPATTVPSGTRGLAPVPPSFFSSGFQDDFQSWEVSGLCYSVPPEATHYTQVHSPRWATWEGF